MAYSDEERMNMYLSIQDDLTTVVAKLEDFLDAHEAPVDSDQETPESRERKFVSSTANQLTNLVGSFAVRAKRCEDSV